MNKPDTDNGVEKTVPEGTAPEAEAELASPRSTHSVSSTPPAAARRATRIVLYYISQ